MLGLPLRSSNPDLADKKYIAAMFASGEQGAWYDPSDLSTMYQDAAGTIPVTAVGQPVGKILDKSGRGNHATQGTTTSRPTLQQDASGKYYLSFDGVDDYLSTGSIDFSSTDKMTVLAGLRKLRDSPSGTVVEASTNSETNNGAFLMTAPPGGGNTFLFGSRGTQLFYAYTPVGGVWAAPISVVQSGISEIPLKVNMRLNGALAAQQLVSQGTGKYGNYPLYIGRRGGTTNPFSGNLYGLIVRGAQTDDLHLTHAEKYLAYKSGVTL